MRLTICFFYFPISLFEVTTADFCLCVFTDSSAGLLSYGKTCGWIKCFIG